jgi:transcriptional regulator with XRE-family HTH domain
LRNRDHISKEARVRFGKIIHQKRRRKNLTLQQISKYCGVSLNFISLVERGVRTPSDEIILKLSEILGIESEDLFVVLGKIHPQIRTNVLIAIEHEGLKELFQELNNKVQEEPLRNQLYEEVYNTYLDFLERHNLK